jgi:hypothetical protein
METVRIYRLTGLAPATQQRLKAAQMEAARVWNRCRDLHLSARETHLPWPDRDALQKATKGGQFALHSQSVQMLCHQFLANGETTQQLRATHPQMQMRYPYKTKKYMTLQWPAQAVSRRGKCLVLPMGRGRKPLIFRLKLPQEIGAVSLVWKAGYELHVSVPVSLAPQGLLSQWEYGQDKAYLQQKCARAGIVSFTGDERGTSSRCPKCQRRQKVRGRNWVCKNPQCAFGGHRDLVGSLNMHRLAFGQAMAYPSQITYLRPSWK